MLSDLRIEEHDDSHRDDFALLPLGAGCSMVSHSESESKAVCLISWAFFDGLFALKGWLIVSGWVGILHSALGCRRQRAFHAERRSKWIRMGTIESQNLA